jgi:WD40 repeat protein
MICPTQEELRLLLTEDLAGPDAAALEAHVESCAICQRTLEELTSKNSLLTSVADQTWVNKSGGEFLRKLERTPPDAKTLYSFHEGSDSPPDEATLQLPTVPGYEILGVLGRGSMGVVYKALQLRLSRTVALKFVLAGRHASPTDLVRFLSEAEMSARLQHPNIVQVYDVGHHEALPYFTLEYVDSGTLAGRLKGKPLAPREAAAFLARLAAAAGHAHEHGIVHRDLKPANILLAKKSDAPQPSSESLASGYGFRLVDFEPKVADFGLAKLVGLGPGLTTTGTTLGTPSYMAPEQATRKGSPEIGPAADVYALGVILYEMLTGRPPFVGTTPLDTLTQVLNQEPVPPTRVQPRVPRDLDTICLQCLQKAPTARYANAAALADDLGRFLGGEPIRARRVRLHERVWLWARRNPGWAGMLTAVASLLLAIAVVSSLLTVRLNTALSGAEAEKRRANERLWESLLAQAESRRVSQRRGQRFEALEAIRKAAALPVPPGHSRAELRNAALACLVLADLETVREWEGFPVGSGGLAFDAGLERYAIGDKDGTVRVCRMGDGALLATVPGAGRQLEFGELSFSPDERFLYRRSVAARPELWRLGSVGAVLAWEAPGNSTGNTAFTADSKLLAIPYPDGCVRIFETATGKEIGNLPTGFHPMRLAFRPGQAQLAVAGDKLVKILDQNSGKVIATLEHPAAIGWIEWHPDGELLATACNDLKIRLWRAAEGNLALPPLQGHASLGLRLQFTDHGHRLISNDWSSSLRVWDTATGRLLLLTTCTTADPQTGFGNQGGVEMVGSKLRRLRFASGRELRTLTARDGSADRRSYRRARPTPDDRFLLVNSIDRLALVDWWTCAEIAWLPLTLPAAIAFEPNGAFVTSAAGPASLLRWPTRTEPTGVWRVGPPESLNMFSNGELHGSSSDASVLAIPNFSAGAVVLRRSPSRNKLSGSEGKTRPRDRRVKLGPREDVRACAVSPDGRWVATGNHWNIQGLGVTVWDAQTGKAIKDLLPDGLSTVVFSPDGNWLLTSGGGYRLWHVGTWEEGPPIKKDDHSAGVGHAAFTDDSKVLALPADESQLRLVEVASGAEIARLTVPEQTYLAPQCFSRDGSHLVAIGARNSLMYIWDLRLLRGELGDLGLDWDRPEFPPAAPPLPPLKVQVDLGFLEHRLDLPGQQVIAAYTISLAHLPVNPEAYLTRGLAHGQLLESREAIADYSMFLAMTPSSGPRRAETLLRRLNNYLRLGDDAAALADLLVLAPLDIQSAPWADEAAALCSEFAQKLLTCPEKDRQPEKALILARTATDLEPENSEYLNSFGLAYYRLGRYRDAASALEKSANGDKAEHGAFASYFLAMTYHRLGEAIKAKTCLEQAVRWHDAHQSAVSVPWQKLLQSARAEAEALLRLTPSS